MSHSRLTLILAVLAILFSFSVPQVLAQEPPKGPVPMLPAPAPDPVNINPALLAKIEPQLLKKLLNADSGSVPFIVYMRAQADIEGAVAPISPGFRTEPDPLTKRRIIVDELQRTAQQSQTGVLQQLAESAGLTGQAATNVRSLWIVNAVAARGTLEIVLDLAARLDVDVIRLDKTIQLNRPVTSDNGGQHAAGEDPGTPNEQPLEWGVQKIRADLVRNALGIDGSGVVVANVDTGVDWLHPDLQSQYRGFTGAGKLPNHASNWYDATNEGAVYPVDGQGHGTHTMGTVVGQNGIGVAPGAQWIAVRAFDSGGAALNSWLHAAFQWLLAPAGDPALAPQVVNNSWSSNNGWSTEFQNDIQILSEAGIFLVFSAGNNGPVSETIGSPASNINAFSVGATNQDDSIASFSSRGPSPWGEIKPEVSAPGVNVRSTLPGGGYGTLSGTSMAAPHVTGLTAMLLQASPPLSSNLTALAEALTATAIPLGSTVPNNEYGWGRVDAYNAVMSVTSAGTLSGVVSDTTTGTPLAAAAVKATSRLGGPSITTTSAPDGSYLQGLAPDSYDVTASAFGYQPHPTVKLDILTSTTTIQNFGLAPQPSGYVAGTVSAGSTGLPLAATIRVEGTPVSTSTVNGQYQLKLPVGVYTMTVIAAKHRITSAIGVTVSAGLTTTLSFVLESAPSILVVDSGKWYDASQLTYFGQALNDALYQYDVWQISNPFTDLPLTSTLQQYDIVIWSSPLDSPGYIGAGELLETFLDSGGKLLLSGQDIGFFDGGGFWGLSTSYYSQYLRAKFVKDVAETTSIIGVENEPFAGLSFTINDGDGANNQLNPDVIAVADPDFAGQLLQYGSNSDELAALHVGLSCLPYRAVYFSFGLEGISSRADRQTVMQDSIDLLLQPATATGVDLSPADETLISNFGSTGTHSLRLRNTGVTTDVITLTQTARGPHFWPTTTIPSPVVLPSCQSQYFTVTVQVPATNTWHISDTFSVTAQSGTNPALISVVTRTTKTPAPLLLVDDDRWYSFADKYKEALAASQIPYDFYFVPKSWIGVDPPSPSLETLQMYPMVVWYTAYDWANPLTPREEERLGHYLDGGGRLLFSSQDFLYRHLQNHSGVYQPFVQDYLGVQAHTEDYTSTLVLGEPSSPVGSYLGPYPLSFPAGYRNFTDGLTPTLKAQGATVGHQNQINGITNSGSGSSGQQWRSSFLAYGAELMAPADRAHLIRRAAGWLSWLGDSQIEPEAGTIEPGSLITYTAIVSNNGWGDIATAHFTATVPAYMLPVAASPGITLQNGAFLWGGPLTANSSHTFTFTAQISQPPQVGTIISQTNWLSYGEHKILFDRITTVGVAPNLSMSSMHVTPTSGVHQNDVLTYTIVLRNHGTMNASTVTTTNSLPPILRLIGAAPVETGVVISHGNHLTWTTALTRNTAATLTFMVRVTTTGTGLIRNVAEVDDGINQTMVLAADSRFDPGPIYLPVVTKNQ